MARTWNFQNKVLGKHVFETTDKSAIKSVALSQCGNFGFIGSSTGNIEMFNMQSGILKRSFTSHQKVVTGMATDNLNRTLISCSLDGTVKVTIYM